MNGPSEEEIDSLYKTIKEAAANNGRYINKGEAFVKELMRGLLINKKRYGYMSCPCRVASGNAADDLDIFCPCKYMQDDVKEFGSCYCALYVSKDIFDGKKSVHSIPERRPKK